MRLLLKLLLLVVVIGAAAGLGLFRKAGDWVAAGGQQQASNWVAQQAGGLLPLLPEPYLTISIVLLWLILLVGAASLVTALSLGIYRMVTAMRDFFI